MIHLKINNIILFLLLVSLWFLAYINCTFLAEVYQYQSKKEMRAFRIELEALKSKQQLTPLSPELQPEPIKIIEDKPVWIPGKFQAAKRPKR